MENNFNIYNVSVDIISNNQIEVMAKTREEALKIMSKILKLNILL